MLEKLAKELGSESIRKIIFESGVKSESDAKELTKFYWSLVEKAEGDNMEFWLGRIYTSFHIHIGNEGFESIWEREMP